MLISYPFLTSSGTEDDKDSLTEAFTGPYPINGYLEWHNGKHIIAQSEGSGFADVRAIADGTVVYIDKPDIAPVKDETHAQNYSAYGGKNSWTDKGMVIIEHQAEIGFDGTNAVEITFYSVYAHLKSLHKDLPAEKTPINRKASIGQAGQIYGDDHHLHFEICMDEKNLKILLNADPTNWPKAEAVPTKDGRTDVVFGSTYVYLPVGTPIFVAAVIGLRPHQHSVAHNTVPTHHMREATTHILTVAQWVQIDYAGDATLISYTTDGTEIGRRTDSQAEYGLYKTANDRHNLLSDTDKAKSSPSGWYELLRFGRNLGRGNAPTDKDLLPTGSAHWRQIVTPSGEQWVDLNAEHTFKFSDADFPAFLGWNCFGDDTKTADQRCDSTKLKTVLTSEIADPEAKAKALADHAKLFAQTSKDAIAKKLRKAICKFPSEFDQGDFTSRYGYIEKEPDFVGKPEAWKKFVAHVKSVTKTNLPDEYTKAHWHFHPVTFIETMKKCGWVGKMELEKIYPDSEYPTRALAQIGLTPELVRERYRAKINIVLRKYFIHTPIRQTHFFGQGAVESLLLANMMEGEASFTRNPLHPSFKSEVNGFYSPATGGYLDYLNNKLGNIDGGDGPKFRGRGMKQLTGRANYSKYWVYRGWISADSFISPWWGPPRPERAPKILNPQLLSIDPFNSIDAGGWYWEAGSQASGYLSINKNIVNNDIGEAIIRTVTHAINGGYNAIDERISHTNRISKIFLDKS